MNDAQRYRMNAVECLSAAERCEPSYRGLTLATAASWLSLRTRRPIIIGIIYILLWEGSIATFAPSAAKLSISAYGRAFVAHALPQAARPVTGALTAAVVLVAVVALAAWGAARALVRGELP